MSLPICKFDLKHDQKQKIVDYMINFLKSDLQTFRITDKGMMTHTIPSPRESYDA